jgi:site-specific DNA recombinase
VRIASYIRVSTKGQAEDGVSLDVQATEISRWAEREHPEAEIVEYMDDGYSGTTLARPAIERLLGELDGIDVVAVWRLDRLSRDVVDRHIVEEALASARATLVSVTQSFDSSPEGELSKDLDAILAAYESRKISLRTRVALRRKAERGELLARAPYGYRNVEGGWELVPEKADVVATIDALYLDDGWGWTRIRNHLNELGIPSPGGGEWRTNSVEAVVKRSSYAGIIEHGARPRDRKRARNVGEVLVSEITVEGFVPIRSRETWEKIKAELARRATGRRPGRSIFSGTLRCGECSGSMQINVGGKKKLRSYSCSRHKSYGSCVWNTINEKKLVGMVSEIVHELEEAGTDLLVIRELADRDRLEDELSDVGRKRRRLINLVEAGTADPDEVARRLGQLAARRDELEKLLKADPVESSRVPLAPIVAFKDLEGPDEMRSWVRTRISELIWTRDTGELVIRWKSE